MVQKYALELLCDACGDVRLKVEGMSHYELIALAWARGWVTHRNRDACPACLAAAQREHERNWRQA